MRQLLAPVCALVGVLVLVAQLTRGFAIDRALLTAFVLAAVLYLVGLASAAVLLRGRSHPTSTLS